MCIVMLIYSIPVYITNFIYSVYCHLECVLLWSWLVWQYDMTRMVCWINLYINIMSECVWFESELNIYFLMYKENVLIQYFIIIFAIFICSAYYRVHLQSILLCFSAVYITILTCSSTVYNTKFICSLYYHVHLQSILPCSSAVYITISSAIYITMFICSP